MPVTMLCPLLRDASGSSSLSKTYTQMLFVSVYILISPPYLTFLFRIPSSH